MNIRKEFLTRMADLLQEYSITFRVESDEGLAILSLVDNEGSLQISETYDEENLDESMLRFVVKQRTKIKPKVEKQHETIV